MNRWRRFRRSRLAVVGLALGLMLALAAAGASLISPYDPTEQSAVDRLRAPDAAHLMGRDSYGRDVFTRVLYAGRVSLTVGVGAVALAALLGVLLGLIAGYGSGWADGLVMRTVDLLMAFPSLLLGLVVLTVLGAGLDRAIIAIGVVLAPPFARVVYGATRSLVEREFVVAARCLGAGSGRLLWRHILPSLSGELVVLAGVLIASAIRIEASLSFIGLGVAPPTPSWGNMIRDGTAVLATAPWLSIFPGLAILLAVLAFNLIGDGLRDVLDPRS